MGTALCAGLTVLLLACAVEAGRICERSGYCSLGQVAGYVGPIDSAAQLKQAVEATVFRGELIVIPDTRVLAAAQVLMQFRAAGYGHVLLVTDRCDRLVSAMRSSISKDGAISCGMYLNNELGSPVAFPYFKRGVGAAAWWWKWMTTSRAVALGYNVLAVDSDVVVLNDWYLRVKQPPLSAVNMMCQNEYSNNLNAGFCYFQNAASNGPAMWILYEFVHRVVRWAEDSSVLWNTSSFFRANDGLRVDDQGMLQETVFSSLLGRPVFPSLIAHFHDEDESFKAMGLSGTRELWEAIHHPLHDLFRVESFNVSSQLAPLVCESFAAGCGAPPAVGEWTTGTIRVAHSGGKWPANLGGYPFNATIGPFTAAYRKAFTDLGVSLPPDAEDPATEAAARAIRNETFAYLSKQGRGEGARALAWAQSTWFHEGRHGWWHTHLLPANISDKTALGHIWANLFPGAWQKQVILQVTGHYNWAMAARVAKSPHRVYFTSQEIAPHTLPPDVHSVIAYSPGVIHASMTKEQFVAAAQALAQVAVVFGAAVAWPAVPCESEWALSEEGRARVQRPIKHSIPWWYLDTFFKVQPFGDSLEQLQCEWVGFAHRECLANIYPSGQEVGRGLLAVEFHHLRNSTGARPTADTTLLLSDEPLPPPLARSTAAHLVAPPDLLRLNAASVLRRIQREALAVFWLDRLVQVADLAGEAAATYGRWLDKCEALKYYSLPAQHRERW